MANSIFEKARKQIRFTTPQYDTLPMEPVSQELLERVAQLEKEIDQKRERVLFLRKTVSLLIPYFLLRVTRISTLTNSPVIIFSYYYPQVPESVQKNSNDTLNVLIEDCQNAISKLHTHAQLLQQSQIQQKKVWQDAHLQRRKRQHQFVYNSSQNDYDPHNPHNLMNDETETLDRLIPFPDTESSSNNSNPFTTMSGFHELTDSEYLASLSNSLASLPNSSQLTSIGTVRALISKSVSDLQSQLNSQILTTKGLVNIVYKNV